MRTAHSRAIEQYVEMFLRAGSPKSNLGAMLEDYVRLGCRVQSTTRNNVENTLIRLADSSAALPRLTGSEFRLICAYYFELGGVHDVVIEDGTVVDRWASGPSHVQVAKKLGYKSPQSAQKKLNKVLQKIQRCTRSS